MNGMTRCNRMLARVSRREATCLAAIRLNARKRRRRQFPLARRAAAAEFTKSAGDFCDFRKNGGHEYHRRRQPSSARLEDNYERSWIASVLTVVGDRQLVSAERADRIPPPSCQWVISWGARCPFPIFPSDYSFLSTMLALLSYLFILVVTARKDILDKGQISLSQVLPYRVYCPRRYFFHWSKYHTLLTILLCVFSVIVFSMYN